ncbi:hypothetical protein [Methylobacterium sp. NFXW15]|uniref:hypothetical protein n=1 Tax=Methylobacterium sp. NFXW15 TaxID=2819512 RepID=UPI003CE9322C
MRGRAPANGADLRLARGDEVADLVACPCSSAASATMGAAMRVDGDVLQYLA